MTLEAALLEAAVEHGIIRELGTVREGIPVIHGGSQHIFEFVAEEKRTDDSALVRRCCSYLFGKAVEAVVRWGQTSDGKFSVFYKASHVIDMNLHAEVPEQYVALIQASTEHGTVLFEAYTSWCRGRRMGWLRRTPGPEELRTLFLQCSLIGMSHALERKYHELPGGNKGVVTREPFNTPEIREAAETGLNYYQGKGVRKDLAKAASLLTYAAEGGHVSAQYGIGMMYFRGEGVTQSYDTALKWFLKAAENGMPNAQHEVSVMFCNGIGCQPDHQKAAYWAAKAADQNVVEAIYNMGVFLFQGAGVPQDRVKAISYLRRAAQLGHREASDVLTQLGV